MDVAPQVIVESPVAEAITGVVAGASHSWWQRTGDLILSSDPRRRIRLTQWLISALVYMASAPVMWFGIQEGWTYTGRLLIWCAFVATGQAGFYLSLRSGWSERFADPALTAAQIIFSVICVNWAYAICGPVRSVALMPLLLIFAFGAFSLSWRRIMWLTAFALATLFVTVAAMEDARRSVAWLQSADLRLDVTNVLMIMILLPALSLVATRLSTLRSKLRSQRGALTEALREVQRLATYDELTGLVNRRYMQERLLQEQHRSLRNGHAFSIAVIDLDNFKAINDAQGHAGGDVVLRQFAREASATLRTCDLIGRWGGEEFLVLLPDTQGPQAHATLLRLLTRIRALSLGAGTRLSFSAGVTEHRTGETVAETVARADREMYDAKNAGRNTVLLQ